MTDKKEMIKKVLDNFIHPPKTPDLFDIVNMWLSRHEPSFPEKDWPVDIIPYQELSKSMLDSGQLRAAVSMAERIIERCEDNFEKKDDVSRIVYDPQNKKEAVAYYRLMQTAALGRARMGYTQAAKDILEKIEEKSKSVSEHIRDSIDSETNGIFARVYKDLYLLADDAESKEKYFKESYSRYFKKSGFGPDEKVDIWHSINAATLSYLKGDLTKLKEYAKKIINACNDGPPKEKYWRLATLAEAKLLLGICTDKSPFIDAQEAYRKAALEGGENWSNIQTTRRHLRLILSKYFQNDTDKVNTWMNEAMPMPPILLFTGHMIDRPGRAKPRFPLAIENFVKDKIKEKITELCPKGKPYFGYGSAACGSDILFHEVLQEKQGKSCVILPYNKDSFIKDSVDLDKTEYWKKRFDTIINNAKETLEVSLQRLQWGSVSYAYTNEVLLGLAMLKAKDLEMPIKGIAVWDRSKGDGAGGTADNYALWKNTKIDVEVIDINEIRNSIPPALPSYAPNISTTETSEYPAEIKALLFADVKGFSTLDDLEMPLFIKHFWSGIAKIIKDNNNCHLIPKISNTWGDAVYMVFDTIEQAGLFALKLKDFAQNFVTDDMKIQTKLNKDLELRIALHAGPVYYLKEDEIIGRPNYFGFHVCKAARLEPVTQPSEVFATDAFAALAMTRGIKSFNCEYVGRVKFPKNFGTCETYRVTEAKMP